MFIKQIKTPKGRTYLQIVEGFRNEDGKPSHKTIEKLGYLDELDKNHDGNGFDWAKQRLAELSENNSTATSTNVPLRIMNKNESKLKNIGVLALNPVYYNLEIDKVCSAIQTLNPKIDYSIDKVLRFLIHSRITDADSKRSAYLKKSEYIENFDFSEDQMYRCMELLGNSREQIKDFVTRNAMNKYNIDTSVAHYDGCNFYFEIDKEDEFRKKGASKEGRKEPIVNYGVLSDKNLIPIDIVIYPGNEQEYNYFAKVITQFKDKYKPGKIIYVADRGLNSGENIFTALKTGNGYIYGQPIKSEKHKNFVLADTNYNNVYDEYGVLVSKRKASVEEDVEFTITGPDGKKEKLKMPQLQIVTWSKKYAKKQKLEREKLISKAKNFIKTPKSYTKTKIGDAATFVKFANFDKDGNYLEDVNSLPQLDEEAIAKQEKLDGYFMVVSSEIKMEPRDILKAYSEQKGQERNFRVDKTFLKIRPVYLSRESRIKAHVLVCYITHLLIKLLEVNVLNNKIPQERIIEDLKEYQCALIANNTYFLFKYNETTDLLASLSKTNARIETQSLSMIKNLFKGY